MPQPERSHGPMTGRIRVSVPQAGGRRRTVVIVMTPAEWENMFTVAHGSFDSAFDRVKQTLLSLEPHEGLAVYADCGLEPSTAETLPKPVLPEPGSGTWMADDRHGFGDGHMDLLDGHVSHRGIIRMPR
jgi:hypothetical protein